MPDEWVVPLEIFDQYRPGGLNYIVYAYVIKQLRTADPGLDMSRNSPARSLANKIASGGGSILQEIALSLQKGEDAPKDVPEFWIWVARGLQYGAKKTRPTLKTAQTGYPYREMVVVQEAPEPVVQEAPEPVPQHTWMARIKNWLTWVWYELV